MKKMVLTIKNMFKKNFIVVFLYEFFVNRIKWAISKSKWEIHRLKLFLTVKRHYCFGTKNEDRVFYLISWREKKHGIYSMILYLLPHIIYAVGKSYIPVIDLKNSYMPLLQDKDKEGKENAWEYYFEQPFAFYSIDDVYQSRHVVLKVDELHRIKQPDWREIFPTDNDILKYWGSMFRSYIRLQPSLRIRVEETAKALLGDREIVGISVRAGYLAGMMRNSELYNGHRRQPLYEEFIKIIERKLQEWSYDAFFLACDDREYHDGIKNYFGEKCISLNRRLRHFFVKGKPFEDINELEIEYIGSSIRETTEEYIIETYLLSMCDSLYTCGGGGSEFAYFINGGKYKHMELYDNGVYSGLGN